MSTRPNLKINFKKLASIHIFLDTFAEPNNQYTPTHLDAPYYFEDDIEHIRSLINDAITEIQKEKMISFVENIKPCSNIKLYQPEILDPNFLKSEAEKVLPTLDQMDSFDRADLENENNNDHSDTLMPNKLEITASGPPQHFSDHDSSSHTLPENSLK